MVERWRVGVVVRRSRRKIKELMYFSGPCRGAIPRDRKRSSTIIPAVLQGRLKASIQLRRSAEGRQAPSKKSTMSWLGLINPIRLARGLLVASFFVSFADDRGRDGTRRGVGVRAAMTTEKKREMKYDCHQKLEGAVR